MRSWISLLRTARAPFAILVLCAVGLILPSQTHDMMAALTEGFGWHVLAFHVALIFLGFSAWYWSRAVLSARWGVDDAEPERENAVFTYHLPPAGFAWLPRLLLGTAGLIGIALLLMSASWFNSLLIVGWVVLAWFLLRWRAEGIDGYVLPDGPPPQPPQPFWQWLRFGIAPRLRALLTRAPFRYRFSAWLVSLALLPFFVGAVESFIDLPAWWPGTASFAAQLFPGPAAAVLGLGLMIGPLTVLTFVVDGWCTRFQVGGLSVGPNRPPILALLALWVFVLVPLWFHIHTVRVAQSNFLPADRKTLSEFFQAWVQQCAPGRTPVRPIIVAASGGATKAGLWAARVLYDIEQDAGGGPAVFAVSSVSGGSLGVAAYMALQTAQQEANPGRPFCQRPAAPNRAAALSLDLLAPPNSLYGDALGPILAAWLLADMPRAVFAWSRWFYSSELRGGDSAEAIERAFNSLWAPIASRVPGAPTFDQPFLSLFYKGKELRAGVPIWIANGTDATTGNRILTVPFSSSTSRDVWPFSAASDLLGLLKADVPVSTAINNTARFPVLEPFGDLLPVGSKTTAAEVIDGGYFENEGLQTALELAAWLRTQGSQAIKGVTVEPIIVQVTADADPTIKIGDIVRCGELRGSPTTPSGNGHTDLQVLAPLLGLYNVRGGHSAALLRDAAAQYCPASAQRFFHFYLPGGGSTQIPLNWVLSYDAAQQIWRSTEDEPIGNSAELRVLRTMIASPVQR